MLSILRIRLACALVLPVVLVFGATLACGQEARVHPEVPFVHTPEEVVTAMLKLAHVGKGDVVYDLGCGDGRIVIMSVKDFGAARAVGVDINPERIQEATENAKKAGVENKVKFVEADLFRAPISDATVVTLYLLPGVNLRLKPRLLNELKPGTRIVSHSFDMGDWKPEKTEEVDGRHIYLWTVPAKATAGGARK